MGCVTSKKDINDLHPNIFQVTNVDDLGNRISSGQLEISETEIILHQKGKPPIRWPLKTLRRYGYENQVFSFETGRRCPTGSGIYAFSCRRAEKLFNFVQTHIQIRNEDGTRSESGLLRSGDYLEPRPARLSLPNGPGSRLSSVGSSNASPSPPANSDFPPSYSNYYANEPIFRADEALSPLSPTVSAETEEAVIVPVYMNVDFDPASAAPVFTAPATLVEEEETDDKHCYMNLVAGAVPLNLPPLTIAALPLPPEPPERAVNYAVLDLDADPGSPGPGTPTSRLGPAAALGYATIDFDKTVALSHSVCPNCVDEGSRKTRHNSATPRQSASLSD